MIKKSFLKKAMALAAAVCMMIVAAGCKTEEEDSDVPLTGISLDTFMASIKSGSDYIISLNTEYTVTPDFTPSDATNKNFTLGVRAADSSQNESCVNVSGSTVTGVSEGSATLTVTSADGGKTASCIVTVSFIEATAMAFDADSKTVYLDSDLTYLPTMTPANASNIVEFTSDTTSVATVDSSTGKVTPVAAGSAIITATAYKSDGTTVAFTDTYTVTVTAKPMTMKIDENGTGYVSTTGIVEANGNTNYPGYSGGYIDYLGTTGNIIYSINSSVAQDATLLLHYAYWGTRTTLRGAYVVVNGKTNANIIYCNWTSKNGKNDNVATYNADGTAATYHSIWEDSNGITVSLDAGENQIRLIPVPAGTSMPNAKYPSSVTLSDISGNSDYMKADGSLPNIDYLQIAKFGLSGGSNSLTFYTVSVASENTSYGTVDISSTQDYYKSGTSLTATAIPAAGYVFDSWISKNWSSFSGSTDASYTFNVPEDIVLTARFIKSGAVQPSDVVGFAAVQDDMNTKYTITGGYGATPVTVTTLADLTTYLTSTDPQIIIVSGTIRTDSSTVSTSITVGSNKTIYGDTTNQGHLRNIELKLEGSNIIIRNMVFSEVIADDEYKGVGNDDIQINGGKHIWIDHCEFYSYLTPQDLDGNIYSGSCEGKDYYDGLLDIKNGAAFLTISNNYFHDHWKAILCGSGDDATNATTDGAMRITLYKNYFKDIGSRTPMVRYGKAHVVNNYWNVTNSTLLSAGTSGVNCRTKSEIYVQNNKFVGISKAVGFYFDTDAGTGYWNVSGNDYGAAADASYSPTSSTTSWKPCYTLSNADEASTLSTTIPGLTGVGKLTASDLQ
jgi:pectate lyase